ncbi:hypothetical protein PG990_009307 [Apiospora arundinis]
MSRGRERILSKFALTPRRSSIPCQHATNSRLVLLPMRHLSNIMPDANENQKTENQNAESQTGKQVNGDEKPEENQDRGEDHLVNVDEVIDENSGHTGSL